MHAYCIFIFHLDENYWGSCRQVIIQQQFHFRVTITLSCHYSQNTNLCAFKPVYEGGSGLAHTWKARKGAKPKRWKGKGIQVNCFAYSSLKWFYFLYIKWDYVLKKVQIYIIQRREQHVRSLWKAKASKGHCPCQRIYKPVRPENNCVRGKAISLHKYLYYLTESPHTSPFRYWRESHDSAPPHDHPAACTVPW